ncbi:MAG TPA: fumarylacetoacetate hydrolase family protein [Steroidobacteraceae bacterium]|nr:fumarylacetoacetate hydrolase family protein [Steroidobacteraceae bacterium]
MGGLRRQLEGRQGDLTIKLATFRDGTRDGRLIVVSRDLKRAAHVPHIATTLQAALDEWERSAPRLAEAYEQLERNNNRSAFPFEARKVAAPLPRAYQWADGSSYVNHMELVRKARGAEMPPSFWSDPLMYQGGSDDFLGPMEEALFVSEDHGIDLEAEVAVITDDVPLGVTPEQARGHIKLLMLVNDWSLRNLIPAELAKGFGFYQSKPATAFSPVALTPDELGDAWDGGKVNLPLVSHINGQPFGHPNAGVDMTFDFPRLIAHAALTRRLRAGSIIGSGTVSNKDRSVGSSCLAEQRSLEQIADGQPRTPFLKFGDRVRIEMLDANGRSLFGAIDQKVVKA